MPSATSLSPNAVDLLNRLVAMHCRSLPVYLADTTPWGRPGQSDTLKVIREMAADHLATVDLLAELISESGERVETGGFPLVFTCYNDLSLDFLVRKTLEFQERDLREIDDFIAQLADAPRALALAQEIRGSALAHIDALDEIIRGGTPADSSSTG
ncbi:MAG: hypothetical protein FJ295_10590 [Planctomycetes bacterium]|nr:hypothetical protein [Planctomycetota bacterium]